MVFFSFQKADGAAEAKQAIRVRRLKESVFTSMPKIEEKKEKVNYPVTVHICMSLC